MSGAVKLQFNRNRFLTFIVYGIVGEIVAIILGYDYLLVISLLALGVCFTRYRGSMISDSSKNVLTAFVTGVVLGAIVVYFVSSFGLVLRMLLVIDFRSIHLLVLIRENRL